jgi:RNA polymerase sigma-B factor
MQFSSSRDVTETEALDSAELAEQFAKWRDTRDPAIGDQLASRFDWLAAHAARRFRDRGEPNEDLLQVARLGLLKAIDRFDDSIGTPFTAFATITMLGELRRYFRDTTWRVHVPRRLKDLQTTVRGAIETLTHELERAPRPSEVAERLGISEDLVLESLDAASAYRADSIDAPNAVGSPVADRLSSDTMPMDASVELRQLIEQLPDREREIIQLRFFDGWSQAEIAERVGISQVHVSRLLRATLASIRKSIVE